MVKVLSWTIFIFFVYVIISTTYFYVSEIYPLCKNFLLIKIINRWNLRLNVIVSYPILLFIDFMIALTTPKSFINLQKETIFKLKGIWNKI